MSVAYAIRVSGAVALLAWSPSVFADDGGGGRIPR